MITNAEKLQAKLKTLKLYHTAENIDDVYDIARDSSLTHERFLEKILEKEITEREERNLEKSKRLISQWIESSFRVWDNSVKEIFWSFSTTL